MFGIATSILWVSLVAFSTQAESPRGWLAAEEHENPWHPPEPSHAKAGTGQMSQSCGAAAAQGLTLEMFWLALTVAFIVGISIGYMWSRRSTRVLLGNFTKGKDVTPIEAEVQTGVHAAEELNINGTESGLHDTSPCPTRTNTVDHIIGVEAGNENHVVEDSIDNNLRKPPDADADGPAQRDDNPSDLPITEDVSESITAVTPIGKRPNSLISLPSSPSQGVAVPGSGSEIDEAAQLVSVLMASLQIDAAQLGTQERLQLAQIVLQAWHGQQSKRHSESFERLGTESNEIQSTQRDISARQAAHIRARDAAELLRRRTADFRRMCSDTMATGVLVMVSVGVHQVWTRGTLGSLGAQCGSTSLRGRWSIWLAWRAGEIATCYMGVASNAVAGVAVLFAAPWVLYRSGLLSDYHSMPFAKLAVGLGLVCGIAGYTAVGRVGGDAALWLRLWELWTVLHIGMSAFAHRACRRAVRAAAARSEVCPEELFEDGSGWVAGVMWVVLGFILPMLAATLPFVN